jgi:hypothetical protein
MERMAIAVAVAVLAAGCADRPHTATFVRQARVEGRQLVVERCRVSARGDQLWFGRCASQRVPLPVVVERRVVRVEAPRPPRPPSRPALAGAISPEVRDALVRCARPSHAGKALRVILVVDAAGAVTEVEPDVEDPALVACAGQALAAVRFPASPRGGTLTINFRVGAEAP